MPYAMLTLPPTLAFSWIHNLSKRISYTRSQISQKSQCDVFYPIFADGSHFRRMLPVQLDMPRKVSYGLALIATFVYHFWVLHIFDVSGRWVYSYIEGIGRNNFIYVFFPSSLVVVVIFQFIGWKINSFCCPRTCSKKLNTKKN